MGRVRSFSRSAALISSCVAALLASPSHAAKRADELNLTRDGNAEPALTALVMTFFQAGGRSYKEALSGKAVSNIQLHAVVDMSLPEGERKSVEVGKGYLRLSPGRYKLGVSCNTDMFLPQVYMAMSRAIPLEIDVTAGKAYVLRCRGGGKSAAVAVQEIDQQAIDIK